MMTDAMTFENRANTALGFSRYDAQQEIVPRPEFGQKRQDSIIERLYEVRSLTQFHKIFLVALRQPVDLLVRFAVQQLRNSQMQRQANDRMRFLNCGRFQTSVGKTGRHTSVNEIAAIDQRSVAIEEYKFHRALDTFAGLLIITSPQPISARAAKIFQPKGSLRMRPLNNSPKAGVRKAKLESFDAGYRRTIQNQSG